MSIYPPVDFTPQELVAAIIFSGMRTNIVGRKGQLFTMWHKRLQPIFWLFSLLNRINAADRGSLEMDTLEKLLVMARAAPFCEFNCQPVEEYRKKGGTQICDQSVQTRGNSKRVLMGSRAWIWTLKKWCSL